MSDLAVRLAKLRREGASAAHRRSHGSHAPAPPPRSRSVASRLLDVWAITSPLPQLEVILGSRPAPSTAVARAWTEMAIVLEAAVALAAKAAGVRVRARSSRSALGESPSPARVGAGWHFDSGGLPKLRPCSGRRHSRTATGTSSLSTAPDVDNGPGYHGAASNTDARFSASAANHWT